MATYYVKTSGGTGAGTSDATAWSYSKYNSMASSLVAGDTVQFLQGDTFNGALTIKSGSSGNPVIYRSYNNGTLGSNPIINGFSTASSWTPHATIPNVYYASVNFPGLNGVMIDGTMRAMGRYPNTGYLVYDSNTANTSISGTSVGTLPTSFVGAEVVIKKWRYIIDRHPITAQNSTTITYSSNSSSLTGNNTGYEPTPGNGYFIQSHIACLDTDGDWYYDDGTHRLYIYSTGSPSSKVVKYNSVVDLVTMNSSSNVTFIGIDFVGGGIGMNCNGVSNITITNCNFSYQTRRCSVYANFGNNLVMTGGSIRHNLNTGFLVEQGATTCRVDGVTVDDIGMIPGMGWSGDHGQVGVWMNGDNITVSNCIISNIGYVGVGSFDTSNLLFEQNDVSNYCAVKDDGGGLYTFISEGLSVSNRVIQCNRVRNAIGNYDGALYNGDANGEAAAIYLDGYSNHTVVHGNVCTGGPWAGILVNGNSFNSVTNNVVYDFLYCFAINQISTSGVGAVRSLTVSNNKFIARYASQFTMFINILLQADNPQSFGTFTNNYYARPIAEGNSIRLTRQYPGTNTITDYSVSTWKSAYPIDSGSSASLVTTDNDTKLRFEYNFTPSSVTRSLGAVYKDITNTAHNGSTVISSWGGMLLIYQSALVVVGTGKIAKTTAGKILVFPDGDIITL